MTRWGDSRIGCNLIHDGKHREVCHDGCDCVGDDFDGSALRLLARQSRDADQTRRLLALAEIYAGGARSNAARIGGVGLQIVRDWVLRCNAGGPDGLVNGKAPGAPSILDDSQRQALRQAVADGPVPAVHGVVRWRLIWRLVPGLSTAPRHLVLPPHALYDAVAAVPFSGLAGSHRVISM